jgi:NADH-quinone oxidoreductase subunit N
MITTADLASLTPYLVLAATPVTALVVIALRRSHPLTTALTAAGLSLALAGCLLVLPLPPRTVASLLIVDRFSGIFTALILAAGLLVTALSFPYLNQQRVHREEYYVLIATASLGAAVLAASTHFVSLFLGLETLSVSLYALIAFIRSSDRGVEAGIKYLILAAVSSAFLLLGMALVYAETGSMEFGLIATRAARDVRLLPLTAGLGLIIVGAGFKLALAPFHLWTPDVYEGAPAPVSAFIATVSKGAVFALLIRFSGVLDLRAGSASFHVLAVVSVASMVTGNLLALLQPNVKRLLAYSSIAHAGYLLVALLAGGPDGRTAVTVALVVYFLAILGAFGVVTALSEPERDADGPDDYQGLAWRRPWLAAVLTAMLLSLAGIPLTAGFVGKFYLIASGVGSSLWVLVFVLVISSVIGLFYYLRVVTMLFGRPGRSIPVPQRLTAANGGALVLLLLLLLWAGLSPGPLIDSIAEAVRDLR